MGVSVERLYRVTIGDHAHLLEGDEVQDLVLHVDRTDHTAIRGDITPPAQIASGPVVEASHAEGPIVALEPEPVGTAKPEQSGAWGPEDSERLRTLAAEGRSGPQVAAAMGKPVSTIYYRASRLDVKFAGAPKEVEVLVPAPAPPPVADDAWSDAQSRYLVDLMTRPNASMQYATTCCGHSFMQTSKRWTVLKAAGIASVADWDESNGRAQA